MSDRLYKTDTNAVLRFYETHMLNNFLSEQSGKQHFDTVLMAEVITPGQSASTLEVEIERTINREDGEKQVRQTRYFQKYKAQVQAYREESGQYVDEGMPVRDWSQIDRGTAETLCAQGIYTVEALAGISDGSLSNIGIGARQLREKAKAFLTSRDFGIPSAQMAADHAKLEEENTRLVAENAELRAKLDTFNTASQSAPKPAAKSTASKATGADAQQTI